MITIIIKDNAQKKKVLVETIIDPDQSLRKCKKEKTIAICSIFTNLAINNLEILLLIHNQESMQH